MDDKLYHAENMQLLVTSNLVDFCGHYKVVFRKAFDRVGGEHDFDTTLA